MTSGRAVGRSLLAFLRQRRLWPAEKGVEKESQRRRQPLRSGAAPLRIAVIGAGRIARQHLRVLVTFEDVEIVGVCNRGGSDLTPLAAQYHIPQTFSDWRRMLEVTAPEAVVIAVSHFETVGVTAGCLSLGLPCLIEKPPGFTVAETASLAELAERQGVINMVALNRRYYSVMDHALAAVREHGPLMGIAIEAPENIRLLRDQAKIDSRVLDRWLVANNIHAVDLFRRIGGEVAEVHAFRQRWHEPTADSFSATIQLSNGVLGTFVAHWQAPGPWRLQLYGEGVRACLEPLERGELWFADGTSQTIPIDPVDREFKAGFYTQASAFVDAVIRQSPAPPPASDLADAVKTMELLERIGGTLRE